MTDRRTPVDHELNARTPLDHLEVGLALLRTADNPATPPRPRRFCARLAAAHFAAASAMQALGVGEHTLDTRPALVLAGPSAGLMATVHRTGEVYSADVRPHVPHVDNYGDPRLHLIVDGVSACGLQSPQLGTHDPAETDCRACGEALQRGGDEAGLPPDGQAADALGANERAQARHDAAGDDLATGYPRAADLRSGEGIAAAIARTARCEQHEVDTLEGVYDRSGVTDDEAREFGRAARQAAREAQPPTVEAAVHAPGDSDETACGIHYADIGLSLKLGVRRSDVTCAPCADAVDAGKGRLAPAGWDKIEGDPDAVEDLDPMAIIIGRSLAGELIDMTAAVVRYADEHKLRWWQCRYCGRGRIMAGHVIAREEGDACLDHEAHCEFAGANA